MSETIAMPEAVKAAVVSAALNSFALDYVARSAVGGSNLNPFILKQLPIPAPETFEESCSWSSGETLAEWILPRVLELTYTAVDMEPFARDLGYGGAPFVWEDERRFWLRAELDAAFFHLYGIDRDDVDYIMETFPIVKRKDIVAHGTYRTKEAILSIYDEMAEAMANGTIYQTHLDPPPANGWVPPPLPPLEDLIQKDSMEAQAKPVRTRSATQKGSTSVAPEPKWPTCSTRHRRHI